MRATPAGSLKTALNNIREKEYTNKLLYPSGLDLKPHS